ncbi:hypothetical protein [Luteolibacter marinus]|uniref:hypothetical protein n=1 Tax=Luteolibacter marinus TaxID=2776705 RepID=UPI0018678AF1|nr:hypothetical protein [Luteolibacter marinus]
MANVFAILSAIALAAAAFLAVNNKEKYADEITAREKEQDRLAKTTARLGAAQQEFNDTEVERKATEEETVGLREKESAQQAKNKKVEDEIAAKRSESDANETKISEIEDKLKEVGNIEELVGIVKRTGEEIERLTTEIAANEATLNDLNAEIARTDGVKSSYSARNSNYSNKRSFFSSTRISSIYPAYGFVTLPIGNNSGVVSGSSLAVVRDGAPVAKLRVSSVEAGRAAAEIVPDSVAQDTVLMVGDRVVPSNDAN